MTPSTTPSTVSRLGGRSHRARLTAMLAVPLLAVPLLSAAASPGADVQAGGAAASTPPTQADSSALVSTAAGQVEGTRVTLITGDVVTYREQDGEPIASIEPAPRDEDRLVTFVTEGDVDAFYVYPSDVAGYVHEGRLDRELFNVAGLVRQGLDDASTGGELPVIVTFDRDRSRGQLERDASALPAVDEADALQTVNGAAVTLDSGEVADFRDAVLSEPEKGARVSSQGLDGAVKKVWLDSVLTVDLDESVPQIGAPEAWDAGFTGEGVTVAVLDTGVDTSHPDLAGQVVAAENFTDEPDATDGFGHGTHVASTIAGTGAASGGQYTGVAPDADLISGKVCNAEGECEESAIIAAMEWATSQGADVVNLSLGGAPTDGTDPLSQTLNQLSADTDTLFVVSAGNSRVNFTIGSPGSADAALTVGAVDKTDRHASFSSQGPRIGDFAVKPDIAAPGVDIVAARATGTAMGVPVDDHYTAANGTSMSSPHVAGAAALLAQAKPDLSASALKNAVASTSTDIGLSARRQGAGRVDVAAALTHDVYAPASASFGSLSLDDEPVTREVVYTNHGDTAITLDLTATLSTFGEQPADGLALSADTLTVPAHGQASVTATVDPTITGKSLFDGVITATADGVALRTAVGFGVGGQEHTVTIEVLDSQGNPYTSPADTAAPRVYLVNDTFEGGGTGFDSQSYTFGLNDEGVATGQVPSGKYTLMAVLFEGDPETSERTRLNLLLNVEAEIDSDTTITLDARTATGLDPSVPQETEVRTFAGALHRRFGHDFGGLTILMLTNARCPGDADECFVTRDAIPTYVTPAPAGELQRTSLYTHWTLADPQPLHPGTIWNFGAGNHDVQYSDVPDYIYNLPFGYENGIPKDLHHEVTRADLVEVPTRYHADNPDVIFSRQFEALPTFGTALAFGRLFVKPGATTEYFLADDQFTWRRIAQMHTSLDAETPGSLGMLSSDRFLEIQAGNRRSEDRWFDGPLRYGAVDIPDEFIGNGRGIVAPTAFSRGGPDGNLFAPGSWLMDNGRGHGGTVPSEFAFGTWRMWNADTGTELEPSFNTFTLAPGEATYRLEKTWSYPALVGGLFNTKSASTTEWTFKSQTVTGEPPAGYRCPAGNWRTTCEFQPIIQLRYGLDLDLQNRAPAGRAHVVTVEAGSHSKTPDRSPVTDIGVEYSTDGGDTWTDARTMGKVKDGTARVVIQHPKLAGTDGFVSLRVKAEDADGNTVDQTTMRAYALKCDVKSHGSSGCN